MPEPQTSILLRKGPHDGTPSDATTRVRYALLCDNFSVQIAKTPIQVPAAQQSPILIDIGFHRPSISINGLVPTLGDNILSTPTAPTGYEGMASFDFTRDILGTSTPATCKYFFPYKNALEHAAITWIYTDATELEIEIGDSSTPTGASHTGGGVYKVAIQQCRFQIDASKEDRWTFAMQFVCKSREGVF